VCARRFVIAAGWIVMLCVSSGCPDSTTTTMTTAPTADLSVAFHLDPLGTQVVSPPQTLTYRVIVDSKGVLNAGVEFEVGTISSLITATVSPTRIAETARETQLVVQVPAGTRPDDYDFALRARLNVAGQGAPNWASTIVPLRVASNESGFSVTCTGELVLRAGQAETMTCRTIRDQGFNAVINLSFTNRPGYITIAPETASVGPDVGGFAFTVVRPAAPAVTPAFFDLVAMAQSGGLTRQSTIRLHFPAT
jgi:hypothetical protein